MAAATFSMIGRRVPRVDGADRLIGSAIYGADIKLPGALYGRTLRSPHAHARILQIDTSRALAAPGVLAVVTGQDFPSIPQGTTAPMGESVIDLEHLASLIIARDRVLFVGHPVAAIAATDPHAAEAALELIEVKYEVLPPVASIEDAIRAGASVLHEDLHTVGVESPPERPSNIAQRLVFERGDVDAGFRDAAVVAEGRFRIDAAHQGYLEPLAAAARAEADGRVTVWTSTQGSFTIEWQVAQLLGLPLSRVRVIPLEVGGAFGGKIQAHVEPLCARLAQKAGRPVRMVLSREEVFCATGPGAAALIEMTAAAAADGKLTALEMRCWFEAGAYPGSSMPNALRTIASGHYRLPALRFEGFDVVTNKPRVEAYRAPGGPQTAFALEQIVDDLAQRLGLDPLELRRRNVAEAGYPLHNGRNLPEVDFARTLDAVAQHPCWTSPLPTGDLPRGRGLGIGFWPNQSYTSSCQVAVTGDGTLTVNFGAVDITGVRTALAQVAAEEFGLDVAEVAIQTGDTDTSSYNDVAAGSRTTRATATALSRACRAALATLRERAAALLECAQEDVEYAKRQFRVRGAPERAVALADLARRTLTDAGGPVVAEGVALRLPMAPAFAVHVADVEVDPATGKVSLLSYTAFQDVGRAINPTQVEGQIQGGAAQGIGWVLLEGEDFDERACLRNASLLDYRLPTALDLPPIEPVLIEAPAPDSLYGVRGVGEVPIVPPAGAVANAVARALGRRVVEMPMTPERVLRALRGELIGQV